MRLVVMAVVGLAAGVLNYAAASGSIIPFLVMCSFGVPMPMANATVLTATPASFIRALWEIKTLPRLMVVPLIVSALASIGGAVVVATLVTGDLFRVAVPYVLIFAVVALVSFGHVRKRIDEVARRRHRSPQVSHRLLVPGVAATSAYAGMFGASVGVLILALCSAVTPWPWRQIAAVKNLTCLTTSTCGLMVYAASDLVLWPTAIVLAITMAVGGAVGKVVADRVRAVVLRRSVAAVTLVAALALIWTS
nr:sulfite exporter TauE/SafE family protein [Kibdelosporangium phytohabitans]